MVRRARLIRTFLAATLLGSLALGGGTGCPKKDIKPDQWTGPDPDTNSGQDAKRGGAKLMMVNRAETDSVSWPKLVRTKWKRLEIATPGVQNVLDCELRIDNTGADLNIEIFNSLGTQIGFTPGPAPNKLKKLAVELQSLGVYFLRIQAAAPKDESDFSVICNWEEQAEAPAPPDKPTPTPVIKPPRKPGHKDPPPPPPPNKEDKLNNGIEGRVIQAYREGGDYILNLDKGEDAGIKPGTEGTILSGRSGREALDGGEFKVTKVLDGRRSVAKSSVRSIGKNNRVVFFK